MAKLKLSNISCNALIDVLDDNRDVHSLLLFIIDMFPSGLCQINYNCITSRQSLRKNIIYNKSYLFFAIDSNMFTNKLTTFQIYFNDICFGQRIFDLCKSFSKNAS